MVENSLYQYSMIILRNIVQVISRYSRQDYPRPFFAIVMEYF